MKPARNPSVVGCFSRGIKSELGNRCGFHLTERKVLLFLVLVLCLFLIATTCIPNVQLFLITKSPYLCSFKYDCDCNLYVNDDGKKSATVL